MDLLSVPVEIEVKDDLLVINLTGIVKTAADNGEAENPLAISGGIVPVKIVILVLEIIKKSVMWRIKAK